MAIKVYCPWHFSVHRSDRWHKLRF